MGQVINVEVLHGVDPNTVTFSTDRGLTGQGLRKFTAAEDASGNRPEERLARELFAIPGVQTVFVYGNVLVVGKSSSVPWDRIEPPATEAIRNLFIHYDVNRV